MRKLLFSALALPALACLISCGPPELSPEQTMALRQAESREVQVPYAVVWAATINFLQDNYYDLGQANKDSLILTANKVKAKNDPSNELYWSGVEKNDYIVVNLTFDPIDESDTKVRVNITTTRDKGSVGFAAYGMVSSKNKKKVMPITDPAVYKAFLDNLNREIQRRWMAQQMRDGAKKK
jgi:hypothetical protein